ncbi:MAG: helix-turn-helix domain-containing protein [Oscillospiraceae bacterium]|nr:helix-turn-helix domain-containing protein [Oscillospiraceae bacterium]
MITEFGKALRKLRIDCGEILLDMAKKLEVTPSFLSAVEVGKKGIPAHWLDRLSELYQLSAETKAGLERAAAESVLSIKLNLSQVEQPQRKAALVFARSFDTLSSEEADKLLDFFKARPLQEAD